MLSKLLSILFPSTRLKSIEDNAYEVFKSSRKTGILPTKNYPYQVPALIGCLDYITRTYYNDKDQFVKHYNKVIHRLNKIGCETNKPIDWVVIIEPFTLGYNVYGFYSPTYGRVHKKAMDRRSYFLTH